MWRKLALLVVEPSCRHCDLWFVTRSRHVSAATLPPTPQCRQWRDGVQHRGCAACHAVPVEPRTILGGGLALLAPRSARSMCDISPHPSNGIGSWSEADFVTAMLKGTSPQGTHYYPAFPYGSYALATVSDVRDLFAYIKTLPPLSGRVRPHALAFPFDIRRLVGGWKFLFLDDPAVHARSGAVGGMESRRLSRQRARPLRRMSQPAQCARRHRRRAALRRRTQSGRRGLVPNITQKGLKDWSEKDIAYFLKTGELPDGDTAGGSMARVIRNTALLSDADRAAMAAYLKSLPPVDGPPRPKKG